MSEKEQKQNSHAQVIHIQDLLDHRAKRQQKINEIRRLIDSGQYKIHADKLSKAIAKDVLSGEEIIEE